MKGGGRHVAPTQGSLFFGGGDDEPSSPGGGTPPSPEEELKAALAEADIARREVEILREALTASRRFNVAPDVSGWGAREASLYQAARDRDSARRDPEMAEFYLKRAEMHERDWK